MHVGALEVQNVKRAINRYGTLPKGARIGAYLESLRQSGIPSSQEGVPVQSALSASLPQQQQQQQQTPQHEIQGGIIMETPQHRSLSPRQNNLRNQPQMTRSNSSSGVVSTYQPPSSPRSRCVSSRKNNVDNIGLRTFRAAPNTSTFRTASPSRSVQPTLADLEFPPPPLDLPPPPHEVLNSGDQCDLPPEPSSNPKTASSPVGVRKSKSERRSREEALEESEERDVRTVEPSVKEASSRFGVSLRRRDTSGEASNASAKSSDDKKPVYRGKENSSRKYESMGTIMSPPEESPPPPPPPPPPLEISSNDTFTAKPGMKEMLELKLINEIKHNADMKLGGSSSKSNPTNSVSSMPLDPASQLLSELCASFSMEGGKQAQNSQQSEYAILTLKGPESQEIVGSDKYATTSSVIKDCTAASPVGASEGISSSGSVGFKLKRVEKTRSNVSKEENEGQIIDFKARLRKVDNAEKVAEDKSAKRSEDASSASEVSQQVDEEDDKRRSTGSISSLKRLWENKEASSVENQPLSPKLGVRGSAKNHDLPDPGEESPEDHSGASTRSSTSKSDHRAWPPMSSVELEKPAVPAKPPKPMVSSSKHFVSSIYATPNCDKQTSQTSDEEAAKISSAETTKSAKHNVLEISNAIETSITNLKGTSVIVMASWLQLSDKVGLLHGMCVNLTDSAISPHARFQFRDLLARLELQARQLRAAGTRNITENTRLLSDVQNTIKDVTNMVQR